MLRLFLILRTFGASRFLTTSTGVKSLGRTGLLVSMLWTMLQSLIIVLRLIIIIQVLIRMESKMVVVFSKSDKEKGIAIDENLQSPEVELVPDVNEVVDASPEGSSSGSRKRKLDAAMMQPIVNLMSSYMNESQKSMAALTKAIY